VSAQQRHPTGVPSLTHSVSLLRTLPLCAAGVPQPAAVLQLHMCLDPAQQHLLTPSHLQTADGSGSAGAATATTGGFSTPPRKTPTSSSKKGSKSSSKTPKQGGSSGGGTSGAAAALTQWQLHLLQGGLDWSKPRQRQLLQQLIHRQLLGCCFLPGWLIACLLPALCGTQHLHRLVSSTPPTRLLVLLMPLLPQATSSTCQCWACESCFTCFQQQRQRLQTQAMSRWPR
jgi:hypothetical protein